MNNTSCEPTKTVNDPLNPVKSAYNIYTKTKSELLDHKPYKKRPSTKELATLEKEYKRGLAMCSGRTLDKNLRKVGVLNGEVSSIIDLGRKPSMDIGLSQGITPEAMKLDKEMARSVKNML